MKICIVIQSDAFRDSAGMRIRYDRFRDSLDQHVDTSYGGAAKKKKGSADNSPTESRRSVFREEM